jgi:hypothetical protein
MAMVAGGRPGGVGRLSLPGVIECLGRLPASRLLVIAGCLVGVIAVGDYLTGPDVSFAVGYLVPVFLAATAGRATSTAIAAVTAMTWSGIELVFRNRPYTFAVVPAWNVVARFLRRSASARTARRSS